MNKSRPGRLRYRMAGRIRELLLQRAHQDKLRGADDLDNFAARADRLRTTARRSRTCTGRNWDAAAASLSRPMQQLQRELLRGIERSVRAEEARRTSVPSFADLVAELEELERDFLGVQYTARKSRVVTDPITLEEVSRGPFEIQLRIASFVDSAGEDAYRVVALEPAPAATDTSVSHPHVQNNQLCEGDAHASIRGALAAGRVCDAFALIRSVVSTYNPNSPFVSLDHWHGIAYTECGDLCGEDERCYCIRCEEAYCTECCSCCRYCEESVCVGCMKSCTVCDDCCCESCIEHCAECGDVLCADCGADDRCLCKDNLEESSNEQKEKSLEWQEVSTEARSPADSVEPVAAPAHAA